MKPPPRLRDDPALAPELRADLERSAAAPYAYDTAAGLAGLQVALSALDAAAAASTAQAAASAAAEPVASQLAGAGAGPTGGATLWSATSAKIGLAIAGVAVVAAGATLWPAFSAPRSEAPARIAPRASAPTVAAAREQAVPAPASAVAPQPAAELRPPREAEVALPHAFDADAELRRETVELGRIKALLKADPAAAYALAQDGHRRFRRGMLRHEREGLAVLALWRLDRHAQAGVRTRSFLSRYPRSPLREQLERELAQHREQRGSE